MTGRRVLIDAANLHVGGGVQVAASFLDELATMAGESDTVSANPWLQDMRIEASTQVGRDVAAPTRALPQWRSVDRRPLDHRYWRPKPLEADVSFTIFGPEYGRPRAARRLLGYADVTSIYPHPWPLPALPLPARAKRSIRGAASRSLARAADALVVETEAMRARVAARTRIPADRIHVVGNTHNAIFEHPQRWAAPLRVPPHLHSADLVLACVARGCPHKNLPFVGRVCAQLADQGLRAVSLFTLPPDEWARLPDTVHRYGHNLGPVPLATVPRIFEAADAAIFPSLLESFSVTPLEAMHMGTPLFASDRDFVRTVCGDAATYFDPVNARSAAHVIAETWKRPDLVRRRVQAGCAAIARRPTPRDRAAAYVDLISMLLRNLDG